MIRPLIALLLLGSAGLGWLAWSGLTEAPDASANPSGAARPLPAPPAAVLRDGGQRRADAVAMILARPLFSATRRPRVDDAAPGEAAAPVTTLPRMTAIMIDGTARSAIFDGQGKPTVLREGGRIGPFTVQSIEPQQVTVVGPDGKRVVRTSFSLSPPPMPTPVGGLLPGMVTPLPLAFPPGMPNPLLPTPPLPGQPVTGPAR